VAAPDGTRAVAVAFSPESNATTILVNRLLKAGADVRWSEEQIQAGGTVLPRHSFIVRSDSTSSAALDAALKDLPLTGHTLSTLPAARRVTRPRVGLYQPWGGNADEGWTRWVFDRFEMPYTTLHNEQIRAGDLGRSFEVIILPSMGAREILRGESSAEGPPTLPAPYAGGLDSDGASALAAFVRGGGTLVALDAAADFAIQQFALPVRNVLAGRGTHDFFCPGSILRVHVDQQQFLTAGFGADADVFFLRSPAFEVLQRASADRPPAALLSYDSEQPLRSGWILGEKLLNTRAALVDVPLGGGRVILVGFRAQFRGQTYGTFRVLFNAAYYAASTTSTTAPDMPERTRIENSQFRIQKD
jgi:hypothetical protein